jgi:hypothetical protein
MIKIITASDKYPLFRAKKGFCLSENEHHPARLPLVFPNSVKNPTLSVIRKFGKSVTFVSV